MQKSFDFDNKRVVIIGGSSGIGLETAQLINQLNGKLVIAGRSEDKLKQAKISIGNDDIETYVLDNKNEKELEEFFLKVGPFDYLFTPGAAYTRGPITTSMDIATSCFQGKFWPQYMAVKYALPYLNNESSIVLMSGAYSQRPPKDGASYVACNAAIEALGKALAVELTPMRVNVVSPGAIKTPFVWEGGNQDARNHVYESYAKECALGKIGNSIDIAEAVVYLMLNKYTTGSTLYPDGGYTLR